MRGCGDAERRGLQDEAAFSRRRRAGIPHSRGCRTPSCPSGRPEVRAGDASARIQRETSSARSPMACISWGSGCAISTRISPHIGSRPAGSRRRRYQLATVVRARRDAEDARALAVPEAEHDGERRPLGVERSVGLHDADRARGDGDRLAAADPAVDEQPVALRGAPALGEAPLELLPVRLDAVEGRVLERVRVRAGRPIAVGRVDRRAHWRRPSASPTPARPPDPAGRTCASRPAAVPRCASAGSGARG